MALTAAQIGRIIYGAVLDLEDYAGELEPSGRAGYDRDTCEAAMIRAVALADGPGGIAPVLEQLGRFFTLTPSLLQEECRLVAAILDALSPADLPRFTSEAYENLIGQHNVQYQRQRRALAAMACHLAEAMSLPAGPHEWAFVTEGSSYGDASLLNQGDGKLVVHWTPPDADLAAATETTRHVAATPDQVAGDPDLSRLISFGGQPGIRSGGNWTPEQMQRFQEEWDALHAGGFKLSKLRDMERQQAASRITQPQDVAIGSDVHFAAHGPNGCRAAKVTAVIPRQTANPVIQRVSLFIVAPDGISFCQDVSHGPGVLSDYKRTAVPGEPLPPVTCKDQEFKVGTWHWPS